MSPNLPAIIDTLPPDSSHPAQTQFSRALQAKFLRLLADSGEVRVAARSLPVSHQTVYRMRRACRTFAKGWDAALIVARERAEELLASRATHGVEEEVYYHGEVVATRRRYDSRLLLAHLARLDRMAEREDVAALAEEFDAVVEAFERCGELSEEEGEEREPVLPRREEEMSSGPCNMWSKSKGADEAEEAQEERTEEADPADLPALEARLQAMEAAPPPMRLHCPNRRRMRRRSGRLRRSSCSPSKRALRVGGRWCRIAGSRTMLSTPSMTPIRRRRQAGERGLSAAT